MTDSTVGGERDRIARGSRVRVIEAREARGLLQVAAGCKVMADI